MHASETGGQFLFWTLILKAMQCNIPQVSVLFNQRPKPIWIILIFLGADNWGYSKNNYVPDEFSGKYLHARGPGEETEIKMIIIIGQILWRQWNNIYLIYLLINNVVWWKKKS